MASLEESQKNCRKEAQNSWEIQNKNINIDLNKEKCKVENLKKLLLEKDGKINGLKEQLQLNEGAKHINSLTNLTAVTQVRKLLVLNFTTTFI